MSERVLTILAASIALDTPDDTPVYTVEGELRTPEQWYGFIANVSLREGGGFRFYFSYPLNVYAQNILLYNQV